MEKLHVLHQLLYKPSLEQKNVINYKQQYMRQHIYIYQLPALNACNL